MILSSLLLVSLGCVHPAELGTGEADREHGGQRQADLCGDLQGVQGVRHSGAGEVTHMLHGPGQGLISLLPGHNRECVLVQIWGHNGNMKIRLEMAGWWQPADRYLSGL